MIIRCNRERSSIRAALLSAVVVFALTAVSAIPREARAAASTPAPAKVSEVMVYSAADEFSQLIETVRDSGALVPIAESSGPGGVKWFMVRTRSGNIGWIKASDNAEARKVDDHFRTLPRDAVMVGPVSSAPEPAAKASATGAITVPVRIERAKVLVPVTFTSGFSSATGNLVVDTGAGRTLISKRLARELRLHSVDTQPSEAIGGTISADIGEVGSVKVGAAEVKNMRVSIYNRSSPLGDEGLLGFDFLSRFQVSIDSDKKVMVLTPRKP